MSTIIKLPKPKMLQVNNLPSGNQYLLIPLTKGEKVLVTEIHAGGYVRIRHGAGKGNSVFNKRYFGPVTQTSVVVQRY
jgi:hypothetical protein